MWTFKKFATEKLDRFKRKCQALTSGNGECNNGENGELYEVYDNVSLTSYIPMQRLKCLGHVSRKTDSILYMEAIQGHTRRRRKPTRVPRGKSKYCWRKRICMIQSSWRNDHHPPTYLNDSGKAGQVKQLRRRGSKKMVDPIILYFFAKDCLPDVVPTLIYNLFFQSNTPRLPFCALPLCMCQLYSQNTGVATTH